MFNQATFRKLLLPSLGNVNDYKSPSAAALTDYWYKYILISGVLTSNISHNQLQYALINGINI